MEQYLFPDLLHVATWVGILVIIAMVALTICAFAKHSSQERLLPACWWIAWAIIYVFSTLMIWCVTEAVRATNLIPYNC